MDKPWDKLREPVKTPIGTGAWRTRTGAEVIVNVQGRNCDLKIGIANAFDATGLRQLAEFCNELADQLEGK